MTKTRLSLSHNSKLMSAPKGWKPRGVRLPGRRFVLPPADDIRTVPGLRVRPAAHGIDLDEDGNAIGLS